MVAKLPTWANEMRQVFKSGSVSQFLIHGAVYDLVPYTNAKGETSFLGLKQFLEQVMLQSFHVVLRYDRGTGIQVVKGLKEFQTFRHC